MTHARPCRPSTLARYAKWERAHLEWERSFEGRALLGEQAMKRIVDKGGSKKRRDKAKGKA